MSVEEKDCGLVLDEMSIDEANEFCQNTKQFVGTTTLPMSQTLACKALVFMLVGIAARWKQVVAFEYTGNSIQKEFLKNAVLSAVSRAVGISLRVHFITTDSGSENQRMWKDLGIDIRRKNETLNAAIPHPNAENRMLEIIPDPVHVFKNTVHGWLNNVYLKVPDWYVREKKLTSNIVHRDHLTTIVNSEINNTLRLCHRLTASDVCFDNRTSSIDKMKVCNATKYCNRTVAAALKFHAEIRELPELLTTACFIEDFARWFELINNRAEEKVFCLNDPMKYDEDIAHLKTMVRLMYDLQVGHGHWKPWQTIPSHFL
ncbi:uncharacterized protein LOC129762814 [Toxorhynchites rutilus septentrionalis]|uniref:uncharacterized protein LOC129762814 n=1 Tax=Toxorhynchites rutilus septentrionalis TaxID=329112 RepID=UPI00247A889A|nr:uncharacterized protein LOC129762814 [Toxorhynchites rutilus septentrionalis]XP_055617334.1 uncharacterized protein LOC129762814 [Toxorhynchites rutilus septentrionalis]